MTYFSPLRGLAYPGHLRLRRHSKIDFGLHLNEVRKFSSVIGRSGLIRNAHIDATTIKTADVMKNGSNPEALRLKDFHVDFLD
jgi:hypothetical protein